MNDNSKKLKVKVDEFEFLFSAEEIAQMDIIKINDGAYHVIRQSQSTHTHIHDANEPAKKMRVEIAGENFQVEIKDELDQMLEQMGFGKASAKQVKEIKAPMPGLVLEIAVQEGDTVKEGQKLLILEAMKMENSIMIHRDASIKKVLVKAGQAVEKGQVLLELD